jgi:hypothetical protein
VADLCRRGIKVVSASPADLARLRAAVRPVYQTLESNPATRMFINQITAMRQAVGGAPAAVTCPPASASGITASASALQGTWQVTYAESEYAALGVDPGTPSEGDWGHYTFTFRHGHYWTRLLGDDPGVSPNNDRVNYGAYAVTGDKITFYRHDHAYPGSDTEVTGPFIWSVYRDTLTFKQGSPGFVGGLGWTVKPWAQDRHLSQALA